jgi:hypothetical protein
MQSTALAPRNEASLIASLIIHLGKLLMKSIDCWRKCHFLCNHFYCFLGPQSFVLCESCERIQSSRDFLPSDSKKYRATFRTILKINPETGDLTVHSDMLLLWMEIYAKSHVIIRSLLVFEFWTLIFTHRTQGCTSKCAILVSKTKSQIKWEDVVPGYISNWKYTLQVYIYSHALKESFIQQHSVIEVIFLWLNEMKWNEMKSNYTFQIPFKKKFFQWQNFI